MRIAISGIPLNRDYRSRLHRNRHTLDGGDASDEPSLTVALAAYRVHYLDAEYRTARNIARRTKRQKEGAASSSLPAVAPGKIMRDVRHHSGSVRRWRYVALMANWYRCGRKNASISSKRHLDMNSMRGKASRRRAACDLSTHMPFNDVGGGTTGFWRAATATSHAIRHSCRQV